MTPKVIDVQQFIDSHKLSGAQLRLILLCFLVVAVDGFDTASIGFIAPAIRAEWALRPAQLAPLFASGLFGLMLGAFAVGPIADRHGRKAMLILSMAFFGVASLLSAFSPNLTVLIALRFLTGLGLGGAMPNAITLTSEYCPQPRRSSLVTLMFCGFTIGSAFGGIVTSQLIGGYGWRSCQDHQIFFRLPQRWLGETLADTNQWHFDVCEAHDGYDLWHQCLLPDTKL